MRPVFSVVMPTYGVEKYIEKAIRSVQAQTFENWELLVIDDCTCDQSAEIACEIAKTDSRIRIVHHEINQGLVLQETQGSKRQSENISGLWIRMIGWNRN